MPDKISNIKLEINSLIAEAENGNSDSLKKIYKIAINDERISELNNLSEENIFSALLENQIEVNSDSKVSLAKKVERKDFVIADHQAIAWVLYQIHQKPHTPYIYALAKRMINIGNIKSAQKWYATAALMARIDASMCEDKTAPQGLLIIESGFADIKRTLQNKEEFNQALKFALEQEEKFKKRPLPKWICSHGIEAFSGELRYKDEAAWEKERNEIREKYINQIK